MKYFKPDFWNKKDSIISLMLIPLSFLWIFFSFLINLFKKEKKIDVPVICIGNIYLGGTGKTPLALKVSDLLRGLGKKPAIIKKYYKKHHDEVEMIKNNKGHLYTKKSRVEAIKIARNDGKEVMILDDGFQDKSLYKNLSILCFNSDQLAGNGRVIPAGPLREQFSNIKKSEIIVINGDRNLLFENKVKNFSEKIQIFYSKYIPKNVQDFKGKKLLAFAGIGNPNNFFKILKNNNLNVVKEVSFPDHYEFSFKDIAKLMKVAESLNLELITTEKDFYRIKNPNKNISFLSIDLVLDNQNEFLNNMKSYIND